jgi:FixJ family two-component response regulator
VLEALSRVLREDGWSVETFESAEAFLARSTHRSGCVVLDVTMPGLDGLELQQRLAPKAIAADRVHQRHGDIPTSVRAIKAAQRIS